MDDVLTILGVLGLIISVPTAMGAGLALLRSSYNRARLEEVDKDNQRLRTRQLELERSEAELKVEVAALLGQKNMLEEMVTQRADLASHHIEVMANYDAMSAILGQILASLKEIINHVEP
jgi:hypothetical protein